LTKLDARERESIVKVSDDMRKLNVERLKVEREARVARTLEGDDGDKPGVGRSGRGPRIDLAKPGIDLQPPDVKPGGDKPSGDIADGGKPKEDKPDGSKVTRRVDELNKQLASKGGEAKKTAKLKLPEQSDAIRDVTRNSRTSGRSRDSAVGAGLQETTINLPKQTEERPRINLDRGSTTVRGPAGSEVGGEVTGAEASVEKLGKSKGDSSGRSVTRSGNAGGNSAATSPVGPELKPPQIDLSAGNGEGNNASSSGGKQSGKGSASRRSSDGPKIELPQSSSGGGDAPKIESRGRELRSSQPRIESPKVDAPKIDVPKIESRSIRSGENSIRSGQPRISLPTSSGDSSRAMSRSSGGGG